MEKSMDLLGFGPSEAERAFVLAATAAGLPREIICERLPRAEGQAPLDPKEIDKTIARVGGPMLGLRFIVARVLYRALMRDAEDTIAAQMAVFKTVAEWRRLSELAEEGGRYNLGRLSRTQRNTLRWLLKKADTTAVQGDGGV
jgi:hypothetical protein